MADCVVLNDGTSLILLNDGSSCVLLNGVEAVVQDTDAEVPYYPLRKKKQPIKQIVECGFEIHGTLRKKLKSIFKTKGSLKRIIAERILTQGSLKQKVTESIRVMDEIGHRRYRERCRNELQTLVLMYLVNELDDTNPTENS